MKVDGYNARGTRTSIDLDDVLFSYLAAYHGGKREAREWARGVMRTRTVSSGGPSLTTQVTRAAISLIAKPSLIKRSSETQTDIEDFC